MSAGDRAFGINVRAEIVAVEAQVLSDLDEGQAIHRVIAGVLVNPGQWDVQHARGIVNREEFIANRRRQIRIRVAVCGRIKRVFSLLLVKLARLPEERPLREVVGSPIPVGSVVLIGLAATPTILARTGQWRDQLALFETAVHTYPDSARLNAFVGSLYYFAGDELVSERRDSATAARDFTRARTRTY